MCDERFLCSLVAAGAKYMFPQNIMDQHAAVAWILSWRVLLHEGVLVDFMSICVTAFYKSLDMKNGLLSHETGIRSDIQEPMLDFCMGLAILC